MVEPGSALAVFAVLCLLLAALLWPERGLLPRWLQFARLSERVRLEDALKHVFACRQEQQACTVDSLAGHLAVPSGEAAALLTRLARMGLLRMEPDGPALTAEGARSAVRIVRIHRLWERYLADRTGVPPAKWHDQAERMEHALSTEQADALDARLGRPAWDPHGDPIPDASGSMPPAPGIGLPAATPGRAVEIVHMEDEPPQDLRRAARRRARSRRPPGDSRAVGRGSPRARRRPRLDDRSGCGAQRQRPRAGARRAGRGAHGNAAGRAAGRARAGRGESRAPARDPSAAGCSTWGWSREPRSCPSW